MKKEISIQIATLTTSRVRWKQPDKLDSKVPAHLKDIMSLVLDHCNTVKSQQSGSHQISGFPVHIKVMFRPPWSLLSIQ